MRSKKVLLNVISSLVLQIVVLICGFIVPKLIMTNFGSSVNGLVSSITQFLSYITLLEAGIGPVVLSTLYKPIAKKDKKSIENILKSAEKFFRVISTIFVIYIVVLAVVYPNFVNSEFDYIYTVSLIVIISISIFVEYCFGMTYKLYLIADQKNYIISLIQIIGYVLNTIIIVLLVKFGAGIHCVKLISGLVFVLRPVIQNIYVKRKYNINLKNADKNYDLKQKWDGLAQHVAYVIHCNTDITILTIFTHISQVSVYAVYNLIVKGVNSLIQSFISGVSTAFGDMIAREEKQQLNRNFKIYELIYYSITTIVYTCTILLIVPFVKIYTSGINDANYNNPIFAYILVLSELTWAIRQPYNELTKAAGNFKQTRKGAWIECIVNIVVSLVLVKQIGMVGVAIGTLVAMLIRTVEFIYHASKYILERSIWISIKKALVIGVEVVVIIFIMQFIPDFKSLSYMAWILKGIIVFSISTILVVAINVTIYIDDFKEGLNVLKNIIAKRNKLGRKAD